MTHDKQCEALLMPPDMNRAQLCRCRLRKLAAERKQMIAVIEAAKALRDDGDPYWLSDFAVAFDAALAALEGERK